MFRNPFETPVTTPEVPTVARAVLLLLHVPPPPSESVMLAPTQTLLGPVIAEGSGLTVSTLVAIQPVPEVKVIIVVPRATPDTSPVPASIVATLVVVLAHVPPPLASLRFVMLPIHTPAEPEIAAGSGFTVITVVVIHDVVGAV